MSDEDKEKRLNIATVNEGSMWPNEEHVDGVALTKRAPTAINWGTNPHLAPGAMYDTTHGNPNEALWEVGSAPSAIEDDTEGSMWPNEEHVAGVAITNGAPTAINWGTNPHLAPGAMYDGNPNEALWEVGSAPSAIEDHTNLTTYNMQSTMTIKLLHAVYEFYMMNSLSFTYSGDDEKKVSYPSRLKVDGEDFHIRELYHSDHFLPIRGRIQAIMALTATCRALRHNDVTVASWANAARRYEVGWIWFGEIQAQYRHIQWVAVMAHTTSQDAAWLIKGPVGKTLETLLVNGPFGEGGKARARQNAIWAVERLNGYRSAPPTMLWGMNPPPPMSSRVPEAQLQYAERILQGITPETNMVDFGIFLYHIIHKHDEYTIKSALWSPIGGSRPW